MKCILHISLLFFAAPLFSQHKLDALLKAEKEASTDKLKVNISIQIIAEKIELSDSIGLSDRIKNTEELCKYNEDVSIYYLQSAKGALSFMRGNYQQSLTEYFRAFTLARAIGTDSILADAYYNLGYKYFHTENYTIAFKNLLKAKEYYQKIGQEDRIVLIDRTCGLMHLNLGSPKEALRLFEDALRILEKGKDEKTMASILNNIGIAYNRLKDSSNAIHYFDRSLALREKNKDLKGQGQIYNNKGELMYQLGHYPEALSYFQKGFEYRKKGQTVESGIIESMINIGKALYKNHKLPEAKKFLEDARTKTNTREYTELDRRALEVLKDLYLDENDFQKASLALKNYYTIRDTLYNREKSDELIKISFTAEYEKRMLQDSLRYLEKQRQALIEKQKNEAVQKEKDKRQFLVLIFLISGIILLMGLAFLFYRRNEEKRKANSMITAQRDELKTKQDEITDSINYAKRIQDAILPAKEIKYKLFPDAFILFRPRDIVSGDFYWFAEKNGKKLIAAVDCTGHGVPGAFMSMIGNAFLNEIVNEKGVTRPADILNQLRDNVVKSLHQDRTTTVGEDGKITEIRMQDGMDISLCAFDEKNKTLEFAAANNPIWLVRDGIVKEYQAEKQPIGIHFGEAVPFTQQKIELQEGDSIYLFTDGYADQFGGPRGKKFKYRQMQELFLAVGDKKMIEQEVLILKRLEQWKGNLEQIDDILVIGIRV